MVSGYLITSILLKARGTNNFFKNFYFRRFLRIVPLYYLILTVNFFLIPLINLPQLDKLKLAPAWPYWTFLSNFYIASQGKFENGLIDLSWSLSVEEQFYIFWSLCVFFLDSRLLKKMAITIIVLCPLLRFLLLSQFNVNYVAIHVMSFTRMDTLMMGSILALIFKERIPETKFFITTMVFSIFGLLAINLLPINLKIAGTYSFMAAIYGSLVGITILSNSKPNLWLSILEQKYLALIGVYSYGIYLFHNPIQKALRVPFTHFFQQYEIPTNTLQLIFYVIVIFISAIIAGISFHLYETPWLKLKNRFNKQ